MPISTVFPDGVDTAGNEAILFVPAIADPKAPKVAELTAGWNLQCALSAFSVAGSQSTKSDVRLCTTVSYETPGNAELSIDALEYVYDPQKPDDTKYGYYAAMAPGTKGFLVQRDGLPHDAPFAVGQIVNTYPVTLGERFPVAVDPGSDKSGGKFKMSQKPFLSGPRQHGVKIAA